MFQVRQASRPAVHGHRGSRGTHPENTLPAFQEALKAGADFFEIDIQLTKDDVPIVFHDPEISLRSCTDETGNPVKTPIPVLEMQWKEVRKYEVGNVAQARFPAQQLSRGIRILSLSELFEWMNGEGRGIGVNIEIKVEGTQGIPAPDSEKIAHLVCDEVHKFRMQSRVIIQSFDHKTVRTAKLRFPEIPISCLFDKEMDYVSVAQRHGALIIGPHFGLLSKEIVDACHTHKIEVLPWTVNGLEDWKTMTEISVDGMITDYPRDLLTFLRK